MNDSFDDSNLDLDEIDFSTFHDMLCRRSLEIGYMNALLEYDDKGYLIEDRLYRLKDTLFADSLYDELKKKNVFKKVDLSKIFEMEGTND